MSINRGCLTSIINVDITKRFQNSDARVQVIKTKKSANNNLEIHLSDQEHIFVGISKTDASNIPINSIVNLGDFSINFPKRFLNIVSFNVIGQENEIKTSENKNLTYHSVYKKDGQQQAQQQAQQQQQQAPQQQQQAQQQQTPRPNTTSTPINHFSANNRSYAQKPAARMASNYNNNNNNNNTQTDSSELRNYPITDIANITQIGQCHDFVIRAMVRNKTPIKNWNKTSSEGRLFSLELVDLSSEIRVAVFADSTSTFIDNLYNQLQENKVYLFKSFFVKNKGDSRFNSLKHPCELTFNNNTKFLLNDDQIPFVPHHDFVKIVNLADQPKDQIVDVIGLITEISEPVSFKSKSGSDLTKRSITIADDSGHSIEAVFWNEKAISFDGQPSEVVALKSVKVSEFSSRSLSFSFQSSYMIDREGLIEDTSIIKAFFNHNQSKIEPLTISDYQSKATPKNYCDVSVFLIKTMPEESALNCKDKKDLLYRTVGLLQRPVPLIQSNDIDPPKDWKYKACLECKKTYNEEGNRCNGETPHNNGFEWQYRMTLKLSDATDAMNVEVIGQTGNKIFGCSAHQLYTTKTQQEVNSIFDEALSKHYVVTLSVLTNNYKKEDTDVSIVRSNIYDVKPLDTRNTEVSDQKNHFSLFLEQIGNAFEECKLFQH